MNKIIDTYRSVQRKLYFKKLGNYKQSYAFIGAGTHSTTNIYPCIQHLGVPLKLICTQHPENAKKLAGLFPGCQGTEKIEDILEDKNIKAVFVCTQAERHFKIVRQLLAAGKHVFVEKPACLSQTELQELITRQDGLICMTGLQRRFSAINYELQKKIKNADSYICRYTTGAYPEGDPVMELFIHPIENILRLFGSAIVKSIVLKKTGNNLTFFLQLNHLNNTIGSVELSTNYSWEQPIDYLEINTQKEILTAYYPSHLEGIDKSKTLMNIPLEKVFKTPLIQKHYVNRPGFVPSLTNNNLVMQGFYGEIEHFANLVEKGVSDINGQLETLAPVYDLLEQLKKEVY